jgi:calcium-dependent protein kinase
MYILLTGRPPFNGINEEEIMKKIKDGIYDLSKYPWGIISGDAKDLVKGLLQVNPSKRLSAKDALAHKWFQSEKIKSNKSAYDIKNRQVNKLVENLIKYKSDNILRCAVVALLVHNSIQLNQAHDAVKLFNKIDKNGDGKISREELFNGLQPFKKDLSDEELKKQVDAIFNNIDTDHNDHIEYEEFVRACVNKKELLAEENLKKVFSLFTKAESVENVSISCTNFKNILGLSSKFSDKQWDTIIKTIDKNGDNEIEYDEFKDMMLLFLGES